MRDHARHLILGSLLLLTLASNMAQDAHANGACCAQCGRGDSCQKTCRLVCEQKKVTITCWGCKSEDYCVPGPSSLGWKHTDIVCDDESDPKAPCVQPKKFAWNEWIPGGCAKVYTKKKLMKRTITKSIPSFKWVVEDLCPDCEANCQVPNVPPGTQVPAAPVTDAKIIAPAPAKK